MTKTAIIVSGAADAVRHDAGDRTTGAVAHRQSHDEGERRSCLRDPVEAAALEALGDRRELVEYRWDALSVLGDDPDDHEARSGRDRVHDPHEPELRRADHLLPGVVARRTLRDRCRDVRPVIGRGHVAGQRVAQELSEQRIATKKPRPRYRNVLLRALAGSAPAVASRLPVSGAV